MKPMFPAAVGLATVLVPFAAGAALAEPYQRSVTAACVVDAAPQCLVSFPQVASGKRLEIEYIGCSIRSLVISHIGDFASARVVMQAVDDKQTIELPLSVAGVSTSIAAPDAAYSTLSTPVKFLVGSGKRLKIIADLKQDQIPSSMKCTAVGQLKP
jgi:hypothetical protein